MEERNAITLIMGKDVRLRKLGVCLPMSNLSCVNMMLHVGSGFPAYAALLKCCAAHLQYCAAHVQYCAVHLQFCAAHLQFVHTCLFAIQNVVSGILADLSLQCNSSYSLRCLIKET
jgi:hypothetical protein